MVDREKEQLLKEYLQDVLHGISKKVHLEIRTGLCMRVRTPLVRDVKIHEKFEFLRAVPCVQLELLVVVIDGVS